MEHAGAQNGAVARSNHDRDLKVANGINGCSIKREPSPNKATKGVPMLNGDMGGQKQAQVADQTSKINTLPPEIAHITTNFVPLPFILQRLAQKSHNDLQTKIEELARMPMGQGLVNGNATGSGEDGSEENQNKKANILHFVQDMHSKFVKALVMSEWSRKSGQVSKLIDLHAHILTEANKYNLGLDRLGHIKRNLFGARLPDPDIKTALQVLSTGQAPWMPEFNYIEPPPLTAREVMKWVNELNVLLSVRLSLEDHDKIPHWFRNYSIASGRVTFKVKGEFEVDLTIADDDFEKQFWFIDFRFSFSPAPQELTEALRAFVELKVNEALASDGLKGCYEFLHEFILTHKINELRRQAVKLSRGRWIENIRIERLNRALSIQYWSNRFPASGSSAGPKSWIIIGVNSGRTPPPDSPPGAHPTSYLKLRWFRDGKEAVDANLSFDDEEISAEVLLKRIISKHIEHIFSSICEKLLSKPRFEKRQTSIRVNINKEEPSESSLVVQLTYSQTLVVRINPATGFFTLQPTRPSVNRRESWLNYRCKDPIEDGVMQIEAIRCESEFDELVRRGKGMGWYVSKRPIHKNEMKSLHPSQEPTQTLWLKRDGWDPPWFLVVCLSLAGDSWWLVEISRPTPNRQASIQPNARNSHLDQPSAQIRSFHPLPIISSDSELSTSFFTNIISLTDNIMTQLTDITPLRRKRIPFCLKPVNNPHIDLRLKMPAMYVSASALLPRQDSGNFVPWNAREPWAGDFVQIMFRGSRDSAGDSKRTQVVREVKVMVKDKSKFSLVKKGYVDRDVYYNARIGQFRMSLRTDRGQSVIPLVAARLKAIDRLVTFVASVNGHTRGVKCQSITLCKFIFTYGATATDEPTAADGRWKASLDLAKDDHINISLERSNPHDKVLDLLQRLVNSPTGLGQLAFWLQHTLPLYRAIGSIDRVWNDLTKKGQGSFQSSPRAIEWVTLQWELPPTAPNKPPRGLRISARIRQRNRELWWHVQRSSRHAGVPVPRDEFDAALQSIFRSGATADGWTGLQDSASASASARVVNGGIEALLIKVSDIVKALATGGSTHPAAASGNTQGAAIILD